MCVMNERLLKKYSQMEEQNRNKVLANQIQIDRTYGSAILGVTLQIDLSESARDALRGYQDELSALEPESLLIQPRESQHISLNQVVFWNGQYELGIEKTWEGISAEFQSELRKLDNSLPAFEVVFSKLIATAGGIIWCATDENDEMQSLRETLLKCLPFPKETNTFNNIIHTTVARYKGSLANSGQVLEYVGEKNETVPMMVQKINLRKELVFPSLTTENITDINLRA